MKCVEVNGNNIDSDIELIKNKLDENTDVIFLYNGTGTIHNYIDALYKCGEGLDDEALYKFKICYARNNLNIALTIYDGNGKGFSQDLTSMKQLLKVLDCVRACRIVVNSDKREELAFIVQQLIYIHKIPSFGY